MAGVVDLHAHFREDIQSVSEGGSNRSNEGSSNDGRWGYVATSPGSNTARVLKPTKSCEGYVRGTQSAAAGGVTTVFDFPTYDPPQNDSPSPQRSNSGVGVTGIEDDLEDELFFPSSPLGEKYDPNSSCDSASPAASKAASQLCGRRMAAAALTARHGGLWADVAPVGLLQPGPGLVESVKSLMEAGAMALAGFLTPQCRGIAHALSVEYDLPRLRTATGSVWPPPLGSQRRLVPCMLSPVLIPEQELDVASPCRLLTVRERQNTSPLTLIPFSYSHNDDRDSMDSLPDDDDDDFGGDNKPLDVSYFTQLDRESEKICRQQPGRLNGVSDNGSKAMSMRQPAIEGAQMYPRSDDEDGYKSDDERESPSNRGGTDYTFGETDAGHGSGHESLSSFPQDLVPSLSVTPPNQLVLKNSRKNSKSSEGKCNGNDSNGGSGQVGAGGRGRGRNSPSSSLHVSEEGIFQMSIADSPSESSDPGSTDPGGVSQGQLTLRDDGNHLPANGHSNVSSMGTADPFIHPSPLVRELGTFEYNESSDHGDSSGSCQIGRGAGRSKSRNIARERGKEASTRASSSLHLNHLSASDSSLARSPVMRTLPKHVKRHLLQAELDGYQGAGKGYDLRSSEVGINFQTKTASNEEVTTRILHIEQPEEALGRDDIAGSTFSNLSNGHDSIPLKPIMSAPVAFPFPVERPSSELIPARLPSSAAIPVSSSSSSMETNGAGTSEFPTRRRSMTKPRSLSAFALLHAENRQSTATGDYDGSDGPLLSSSLAPLVVATTNMTTSVDSIFRDGEFGKRNRVGDKGRSYCAGEQKIGESGGDAENQLIGSSDDQYASGGGQQQRPPLHQHPQQLQLRQQPLSLLERRQRAILARAEENELGIYLKKPVPSLDNNVSPASNNPVTSFRLGSTASLLNAPTEDDDGRQADLRAGELFTGGSGGLSFGAGREKSGLSRSRSNISISIYKESDKLTRKAMRQEYLLYVGEHSSSNEVWGLRDILQVVGKGKTPHQTQRRRGGRAPSTRSAVDGAPVPCVAGSTAPPTAGGAAALTTDRKDERLPSLTQSCLAFHALDISTYQSTVLLRRHEDPSSSSSSSTTANATAAAGDAASSIFPYYNRHRSASTSPSMILEERGTATSGVPSPLPPTGMATLSSPGASPDPTRALTPPVVVDCDSNRIKKGPGGRWGGTSGDDKGSPELGERTNCRFSFSASTPVFCLTHSAEEVPLGNTWFKTTPPVRHEAHREALWDALRDGIIHSISSGHSPCHARVEKEMFQGDFLRAVSGTPTLELLLPAVWTEARRRGFSVGHIANWLCSGPAHSAGLSGIKGELCVGADADLVVWDPEEEFSVSVERLHGGHSASIYSGRTLAGRVLRTFVRGKAVFDYHGNAWHNKTVQNDGRPRGTFSAVPSGRFLAPELEVLKHQG